MDVQPFNTLIRYANLAGISSIFWVHFKTTIHRRLAHVVNFASGMLLAYAVVFLWQAVYENGFLGSITENVSLVEMTTYAIFGGVFSASFQTDVVFDLEERNRTGDIVTDLMRPVNWQFNVFAHYLGISTVQILTLAFPVILISAAVFDIQAPPNLLLLPISIISLMLGVFINFGLIFLIVLLIFKFGRVGGFEFAFRGLRPLLTGAFLPLWIFPDWIEPFLRWSPFPAIYFDPFAIYLGFYEAGEIAYAMLRQAGWALALFIIGGYFARRALRKFEGLGG